MTLQQESVDLKKESMQDGGDLGSLLVPDPISDVDYGELDDEGAPEGHDGDGAEHFDELKALGFALARSQMLLLEIGNAACIDVNDTWMKQMTGACKPEDIKELKACLDNFFTRRPVLESTPPKQDRKQARMLKSSQEIQLAWERIFEKRRSIQPNDRLPIKNQDALASMWTEWMHNWIKTQLTDEQQKYKPAKKTSIFNAWVYSTFGGRHFVMAMWQTGMTWAPTPQLLNSDYNGALEHVAKHFASWTRRVAAAVSRHKQHEATQEARRRSGNAFGKHGLTQEELDNRRERQNAHRDYYWTQELVKQLELSNGKTRGKGKQNNNRGAPEHTIRPKCWDEMTINERWWVGEYYNGNLRRRMTVADAKCHKVEANRFFIGDYD